MATYTTPLKTLIEQPTQHRNDLTFKQRLEVGREVLFKDIEYEFFNDMYRRDFEMKFIRHFYNKEIGFETEGQFKFQLETWLQIHMPYFNELFETQLIKYDPLTNIDMRNAQDITGEHTEDRKQDTTEGRTGTDTTQSSFEQDTDNTTDTTTANATQQTTETDGISDTAATSSSDTTATTDSTGSSDTTSNTTTDEDGRNIHSDTPDKRLQIVDDNGVIQYASEITETSNDATANTTSGTTTEDTSNTTTNATGKDDTHTQSNEQTVSDSASEGSQHTKEDGKQTGWNHQNQVTKNDLIGSLTGDVKGTRLEQLKANRYGKDGTVTYQQMVQELRGTFIRIERDIFKEMTELFMLLY